MGLDNRLEEMQEKAQQIARYYYKGFGATMDGILSNAEAFLKTPERTDYSEKAYKWAKEIEDFYSKIPFGSLQGKEEFYPLFIVKMLLPQLKEGMDKVFKEQDEGSLRRLEIGIQTVVTVGGLYWNSLIEVLKDIREFPDGRNFGLAIKDRNKEYVWHL